MMQGRQKRAGWGPRSLLFASVCGACRACADGRDSAPPTQAMVRWEVVAELARKLTSDDVLEDVGAHMAEAVLSKLDFYMSYLSEGPPYVTIDSTFARATASTSSGLLISVR